MEYDGIAEEVAFRIDESIGWVSDAMAAIGVKYGLDRLDEAEKKRVARVLYWERRIDDQHICDLLRSMTSDVWRWVEWGQVFYPCTECEKPVGLWFRFLLPSHGYGTSIGSVMCPECNEVRVTRRHAEARRARAEEAERSRLARLAELRAMPYPEYLQTPEWKARRDRQVEADGDACRLCGSREHLNVHHRTYERIGEEGPLDLVTLCYGCHQAFHENRRLCNKGAPPGSTEETSTQSKER